MWKFLFCMLALLPAAGGVEAPIANKDEQARLDTIGCTVPPHYVFKDVAAGIPYQPYRVRINGDEITWNGMDVTIKALRTFAEPLSTMPAAAGGVTFRVVSVSCRKRQEVRDALAHSGLCQKDRCWEDNALPEESIDYPHDGDNFDG